MIRTARHRANSCALAVALATLPAPAAADLRLVPEPASVTPAAGRWAWRGELTIAVPSGDRQDLAAAGLLAEEIESATGVKPRVASRPDGEIVLARDPRLGSGEEGYRLEVGASGVRVAARTAAGIFYGVQTLRQMVEPDGIPAATIVDRPALRWRGVHDDVSRGPVPTLEALKRRIQILAEYKINLYSLYSEHAVAFRSHPLIPPPGGAFTVAELRELAEFGRHHHVTLMIQQQVFGHLDRVLAMESYKGMAETPGSGVLAAASGPAQALAESLLAEVAPLSTAPFVHVGGDEVAEIGKGQSQALVAERGLGAVYVERLGRLQALLSRHGKRLMFWADFVEQHPDLVAKLPKQSVVALWDYKGNNGFEARIARFRSAGLDVFVCPGVSNWNRVFPNLDVAIPNIRALTRAGQKAGALGQLNCTWDDNGDALFGLCWYPVLYGAAAAWQSADCDPERFHAAFDWAFHRNPGHQAAQAVERVARAHTLLSEVRPTDATLELSWLNPARGSLDRQLLAMTQPVAVALRREQEDALELAERARVQARRNADQLDYVAFAARRLHAIGQRSLFAARLKELYLEALQNQSPQERVPVALDRLKAILGIIAQGREQTALLREEYERLWRAENRPYWLANVLAQFDRDLAVWSEKWDEVRVQTVRFRNGAPLPTAEQMGFAP